MQYSGIFELLKKYKCRVIQRVAVLALADHTEFAAIRVRHHRCSHAHMARTFRRDEHRCAEIDQCSNRFGIIRDEEIDVQAVLRGLAFRHPLNREMVKGASRRAVRQGDVRITVSLSATKSESSLPEVRGAVRVI